MNLIFFLNILADLAANQFSSHGLFICYKAINFLQRKNILVGTILLSVFFLMTLSVT